MWCEVGDEIPTSLAYSNDTDGGYDEGRASGSDMLKDGEITQTALGKRDLEL